MFCNVICNCDESCSVHVVCFRVLGFHVMLLQSLQYGFIKDAPKVRFGEFDEYILICCVTGYGSEVGA